VTARTIQARLSPLRGAQPLADRIAQLCCEEAGYGAALLTISTEAGAVVGAHGLEPSIVEHFRRKGREASLAERKRNRARIRALAAPGADVAFIRDERAQFHHHPTASEDSGSWREDDLLFVLVRGSGGEDIGVLSLDAPSSGMAPGEAQLRDLARLAPLLDVAGPMVEVALLRERLEETEQLVKRRQRGEVVGEVAVEVAHDVNNLLTVVTLSAGFGQELTGDPKLLKRFEAIERASTRAAALTWRLLKAARPGAGEDSADLGAVVEEQRALLAAFVLQAGAHLQLARSPEPLPVRLSAGDVAQILLNLVVNAVQAGASELIEVSTDAFEERGTRFAVLQVADDGCGMDEETRARIFEPFFTTRTEGSGVGLGIVMRLVTRAGGRVRVTTAPGEGSVFRIALPLYSTTTGSP
jgi:signal transduction histidine kinase